MCAVGLSETWLKPIDPVYNLDGYEFVGNERQNRNGGGVGIYVHNDFNYNRRLDLDINNNDFESVFIEIKTDKKSIILGTIYGPPNTCLPSFVESLNLILNIVNKENKLIYFAGGDNINLLNDSSCQQINHFLDVFMVNSMFPVIQYPTRVTINSATLIDNIFTNDIENISSGILFVEISDHFPIFCVHDDSIENNCELVYTKGDRCENNIHQFICKLETISWRIDNVNPNVNYDYFLFQIQ